MQHHGDARSEPLSIPSSLAAILDGWLPLPAVSTIAGRQLVECPLEPSAQSNAFTGTGDVNGLSIHRKQITGIDSIEIHWRAETSRALRQVSLRQTVALNLPPTSYIIAPGAVYGGNRFLVSPQPYCPFIPAEGVGPDGPILIADIPRLTSDTGYRLELAANALTTPFVGIFDPTSGRGALVEIQIYGKWGVSGLTLTTLPGEPISVTITLPVQRVRRYQFCDWTDANEPGMDLAIGQTIEARLRVIPVKAESIPEFIGVLSRRAYAAMDRGALASRENLAVKLREAADLVEAKYDRLNWDEAQGFYRTVQHGQKSLFVLQSGWSGGAVTMRGLIQSPDPARRERARRMLSFLCSAAAPSGYFYGAWDDKTWRSYHVKRPGCRQFTLVRRPLELGRDILFAMDALEARGESLEPLWEKTAQRFLDAVVRTEQKFGHLGYSVDPETGDVLWGISTCGTFALEALVRGYRRFGAVVYLETAERLAAFYRDEYLMKGLTCGGVGDALMAADSESNYALMAGLVHLHEVTQNPTHLKWAVEAADLFQTWVLHYDAKLTQGTPLERLGIEPRGAVFANTQNLHGAPGIYVASGIELTTLAERTGDERFLVLLKEITGCIPQMVVRPGQADVWGDLATGSVSERLMTMDGLKLCGETELIDTFGNVTMVCANELPARVLS